MSHLGVEHSSLLKRLAFWAGLPLTRSGGASREPISVTMMLAGVMDNGKIKRLQPRNPPCDHPFWFHEVTQPHQTSVVIHHGKASSGQVVSEQLDRHHYCQQFLVRGTVATLRVTKSFGSVGNYFFNNLPSILLLLLQHSSYPDVAGVGTENEVSPSGGIGQHGCGHQSCAHVPSERPPRMRRPTPSPLPVASGWSSGLPRLRSQGCSVSSRMLTLRRIACP